MPIACDRSSRKESASSEEKGIWLLSEENDAGKKYQEKISRFSEAVSFVEQRLLSLEVHARVIIRLVLVFGILSAAFTGMGLAEKPTPTGSDETCRTGPLEPLISLLNDIEELVFHFGIALAGVGFTIAGVLIIIPGQNYTRLGQKVAKNTFIGTLLILSTDMILQYLIANLGGLC